MHVQSATTPRSTLTHLQRLEAESIHIMREVMANADNPVMLYSVGKDSACMLHLVRIPEHSPTHSDNMRPPNPEHSPTCDAVP